MPGDLATGGERQFLYSFSYVTGHDDARRFLDHKLGQRHLSAAQRAQILSTAEGNPLFVEQLLAVSAEHPGWNRDSQVPVTIQALLAARLDRLSPDERALIQRAAVIGREFWRSAVLALLPQETQPLAREGFGTLVRRGLIEPDKSTFAGEEQLRFHHILIRDVAYGSTPKALRSELHERFAEWVALRGEGYDEFVGYHLEQAFRYRTEIGHAGPDMLALAERAADSLASAGRRSLARGDMNAAVKLLRRSEDLFQADGGSRPDVLLDLGSALSETRDFRDAERVLQASFEQAQASNAEALGTRAMIELSYWRSRYDPSVRVPEMLAVAQRAVLVFERLGDEGGLSRAWLHVAWANWFRSHSAEMEAALERALQHAERAGERRERSRILGDLARATVIGPRPADDGIRRCHTILERAEGDVTATAMAEAMLAVLEAMDGHFGDARDRWRRSKARLVDVGLSFTVAVVQMYYAFIELLAGCPEQAESEVIESFSLLQRIGERARLSSAAALVGRLLYAEGRYDESEHYNRVSAETALADDVVSHVLWRGTSAKVLAHYGDTVRAQELADAAVGLAQDTDFLMLHGDALSDRAEVLRMFDQPESAARDLEQAIVVYDRKGIRVSADRARQAYGSLIGDDHASVAPGDTLTRQEDRARTASPVESRPEI